MRIVGLTVGLSLGAFVAALWCLLIWQCRKNIRSRKRPPPSRYARPAYSGNRRARRERTDRSRFDDLSKAWKQPVEMDTVPHIHELNAEPVKRIV
jgi:hypothetical protein